MGQPTPPPPSPPPEEEVAASPEMRLPLPDPEALPPLLPDPDEPPLLLLPSLRPASVNRLLDPELPHAPAKAATVVSAKQPRVTGVLIGAISPMSYEPTLSRTTTGISRGVFFL